MKTLIPTALAITIGAGFSGATLAGSKPLYRWVDEKGQVHFGDKVPPAAAKREIETLDGAGKVRAVHARELTAAELRAAEEASNQEKLLEQRRKVEAAHDKSLLVTYDTVEQLEHARDEQLSLIDQRLLLVQKSVAEHEAALVKVRADFAKLKAPNEPQKKQLVDAEQALAEAQKNSASLQVQRSTTEKKFGDDIARFKLLKTPQG